MVHQVSCSCPCKKVARDSQTNISEPDRRTNEEGVDDSDDDADSDASTVRQEVH